MLVYDIQHRVIQLYMHIQGPNIFINTTINMEKEIQGIAYLKERRLRLHQKPQSRFLHIELAKTAQAPRLIS